MNWKEIWDSKAKTENYFTQTGRGNSFTMFEFLLYIQDVQNALKLCKDDNLLDIGGGPGWVSMHLSPFVETVTMFDYSEKMIEYAKKQVKAFFNILTFQDDILKMKNVIGMYDKVLMGSVLQYLKNMDKVKQAMRNIYNVMVPGGIALFTHNPDLSKKESHLKTYEGRENVEEALKMEEERLWLDSDEVCIVAEKIGFRSYCKVPINPLIWQSTHMFDAVMVK